MMFDVLLKSAGIAPADLKAIPEIIKKFSDKTERIELLLADLLEEQKKTNYYLHRQEQRELKKRGEK